MAPNPRLRREREQRGWSQARVAEQIGSDAINVSRWERGFSSPSPHYRERLCQLFAMNAEDLGLLLSADVPLTLALDESPSEASRTAAALSYLLLWVSALVALVLGRRDRFVLFHSAQAALLFAGVTVIDSVLVGLLDAIQSEAVQTALAFVLIAVNVVALAGWVGGAWLAWRGIRYPLPLLGRLSDAVVRLLAMDAPPAGR